ncbi:MAG: putative toxin-antitoxin system toxin component, PIN family [Erysipelotrichaceae bacterium]|nr:putative toxin-antitoxin system toxin component, PIN family [Erysipelotrichaceae bacterium]
MKIVIDTNVVISGIFFNGFPRRIIEAVVDDKLEAFTSEDIILEYQEIVSEMIDRKQGKLDHNILDFFISKLHFVDKKSNVKISRDQDDNKFINCALDSKSLFVVSGDNDLLVIKKYEDIEIITAAEFCKKFLQ